MAGGKGGKGGKRGKGDKGGKGDDGSERLNYQVELLNLPRTYNHETLIELHRATGLELRSFESTKFYRSECKAFLRYSNEASAREAAEALRGQDVASETGAIQSLETRVSSSVGPQILYPSVYISDLPTTFSVQEFREFHDQVGVDSDDLISMKMLPSKDPTGETGCCIARYIDDDAAQRAIDGLKNQKVTTVSGKQKHLGARQAKPAAWMVKEGMVSDRPREHARDARLPPPPPAARGYNAEPPPLAAGLPQEPALDDDDMCRKRRRLTSQAPKPALDDGRRRSTPGDGAPLNSSGLPIREGALPCAYYMKTGKCQYRERCKWHHPEDRQPTPWEEAAAAQPPPSAALWPSRAGPSGQADAPTSKFGGPGPGDWAFPELPRACSRGTVPRVLPGDAWGAPRPPPVQVAPTGPPARPRPSAAPQSRPRPSCRPSAAPAAAPASPPLPPRRAPVSPPLPPKEEDYAAEAQVEDWAGAPPAGDGGFSIFDEAAQAAEASGFAEEEEAEDASYHPQ